MCLEYASLGKSDALTYIVDAVRNQIICGARTILSLQGHEFDEKGDGYGVKNATKSLTYQYVGNSVIPLLDPRLRSRAQYNHHELPFVHALFHTKESIAVRHNQLEMPYSLKGKNVLVTGGSRYYATRQYCLKVLIAATEASVHCYAKSSQPKAAILR